MERNLIDYYSSQILPYHLEGDRLQILFEMKSDDYVSPFFNNSLGLLGGNNRQDIKGEGFRDILKRELKEEFFVVDEPEESLSDVFGQEVLQNQSGDCIAKHSQDMLREVKKIPPLLLEESSYAASYLTIFYPPLANFKKKSRGVDSVFFKKLSCEEYGFIDDLLKRSGGMITTDNLKFGGKTLFVPLKELDDNEYRFSWNCDRIIKDIFSRGALEEGQTTAKLPSINIRNLYSINTLLIHMNTTCESSGQDLTFKELESIISDIDL